MDSTCTLSHHVAVSVTYKLPYLQSCNLRSQLALPPSGKSASMAITMPEAIFVQHPEAVGSYLCCCLCISYHTFHLQQAHHIRRTDAAPALKRDKAK